MMTSREVQIVLGEVTELVSALKRSGHLVHQQSLVSSCDICCNVLIADHVTNRTIKTHW